MKNEKKLIEVHCMVTAGFNLSLPLLYLTNFKNTKYN